MNWEVKNCVRKTSFPQAAVSDRLERGEVCALLGRMANSTFVHLQQLRDELPCCISSCMQCVSHLIYGTYLHSFARTRLQVRIHAIDLSNHLVADQLTCRCVFNSNFNLSPSR